ncbi:MAG: cytochrome-c peroxidase [Acidobacteriota bacterium]
MKKLIALVALFLIGCVDESKLTSEERDLLSGYKLVPLPADPSNRVADDARAAVLGKQFFYETRFSGALGPLNDGVSDGSLGPSGTAGRVSCYECHQPELGGTDHRSLPSATSLGAAYTGRNAPSIINAAYSDPAKGGWQFWDGRKDSQWSQALGPTESPAEENSTRLQIAHVIYDHYKAPYEAIFGALPDLTDTVRFPASGKPGDAAFDGMAAADQDAIDRVFANYGKAIAAYERRLVSPSFAPSPFDRFFAGDETAMSPAALRGAKLFVGFAACNECHRGPTFSDFRFHNIGCPQYGDHVLVTDVGRYNGVSGVQSDPFNRAGAYSDSPDSSHLTGLVATDLDTGAFKTPTLRNVEKTAPYMHDGVYTDLWAVVNHYNFGGATGEYSGQKDPSIQPLLLDDQQLADLVEFLKSLSDGDPLPTADFPEGLVAPPTLP